MKKTINCLIQNLFSSIFNLFFIISAIICFLLCFTSVIYSNAVTGKEYIVLEVVLNKSIIANSFIGGKEILLWSVSPYITIFIPIVSSVPFVTAFCSERISGNIRFVISRVGKITYYISKFISAIISGCLSVMIGYIMYSVVIILSFGYTGTINELVNIFVGMGIYGAVSVLPAFFLSAFIKNKYMICCFPFILMHFYYTIISKIQDYFNSRNMGLTVVKMGFLYPDMLKNILLGNTNSELNIVRNEIIYFSGLTILSFLGFAIIMNRRFDRGQ